jgi:protein-tyrosine-phosphatase/ketosteroid isomerase-like protein
MARVLFVCLQNAGRSQMSRALFERAAAGRHEAESAGTTPADHVHPEVVEAMRELDIDLSDRTPRELTLDMAERADVVVTMGCGDACPYIPGKRYIDWDLRDPAGLPVEQVREVRDDIAARSVKLLADLDAAANKALIERFYEAFDRHDGATMAGCYAPDARFNDPAFGELHGEEPGAMWKMLTGRAEDLRVQLVEHDADETTGSAHWLADYTFTQTGRKVHNDVRASFRFANGLIAEHDDSFDFYAWSRQALGPTGLLLGWTPIVRGKVRGQARASLDEFMSSSPQTG